MAIPYKKAESTSRNAGVLRRRGSITLEAIEDLLAQAGNVREVTPLMIASLCEQRKIDLSSRLARGRRQLYGRYLSHCLEDKKLSKNERADLAHLGALLHLAGDDIARIHDEIAVEVYGEAVNEVLDDFRLDEDEAEFLRELRGELGLTKDGAERLYQEGSTQARSRALSQAQSRDRQFILHREPAGEFTGRSNETLEGAIADGLAKATLAIPSLGWFEVGEIAGYIAEGRVKSWHVTLRAGIDKS